MDQLPENGGERGRWTGETIQKLRKRLLSRLAYIAQKISVHYGTV